MTPELAIVGAGYVGLPLARCFTEAGIPVVLVDVDEQRVAAIGRGEANVEDVPAEALAPLIESGALSATTDYDAIAEADAIVVALPTPLSANREPDLSIVLGGVAEIAKRLRQGHLVSLESTTYPGTTREEVLPVRRVGSRSARISSSPSRRSASTRVGRTGPFRRAQTRLGRRRHHALKLIQLLREEGADVTYHDPHVPELPEHGLSSQELDGSLANADCVAIVTAHSGIDYKRLAERARLVVDFRNATGRNGSANGRVWKL